VVTCGRKDSGNGNTGSENVLSNIPNCSFRRKKNSSTLKPEKGKWYGTETPRPQHTLMSKGVCKIRGFVRRKNWVFKGTRKRARGKIIHRGFPSKVKKGERNHNRF